MIKRARVTVKGLVQGVGFRYTCQREASRHDVVGWVRNLYDGNVESVFEGEEDDVEAMVNWCRRGPSVAEVRSIDIQWEEPTGEFATFHIRH